MQILDLLEQDYLTIYPEDAPILEQGFERTMRDLVLKL